MVHVPSNEQSDITDVCVVDETAHIDIWYPGQPDRPKFISVGLMDVRASDGIRVSYDFDRDGWVIEQPRPRMVKVSEKSYDQREHWIEVAFCQSWQFHKEADELFQEADAAAAMKDK